MSRSDPCRTACRVALLVSAGLFTKSLMNISRVDLGANVDRVIMFGVSPALNGYTPQRTLDFFARVEDELMLGVRFILTGGGGQCISVGAYRLLAERDRRFALARLISRRDSLSRREFLEQLSLARPRTEDPISDREAATARQIDAALDRAMSDYLSERPGFVTYDLEAALKAASAYEPTLAEILPHVRLRPERMQEPERWRIAYERDTVWAGQPAFASDDTLITPERPLLDRTAKGLMS